jgi:SAM-dependent methyltransferase
VSRDPFRTLADNWEAFGRTDPFFGVLSDPTRHGGRWSPDDFFDSGDAHVAKLLRTLRDLGLPPLGGRCLDFGCGVGRLTLPLSHHFEETVGVDVARSMIALARRHGARGHRCRFVVNKAPHLARFADGAFDLVHSCLVLQHIRPEVAVRYVREFLRVCRPGGLVVFQLPSVAYSEEEVTARYALPVEACRSTIRIVEVPPTLHAGARVSVHVTVANDSPLAWPHDIPAGRHITIANHWIHGDGTMAVPDDGRAYLTRTLQPGATCDVLLDVQAPQSAGEYTLEVDLVQERVCWFAERGSPTARARVVVQPVPLVVAPPAPVAPAPARASLLRRLQRVFSRGTPAFEMHVVPREEVERAIREGGGTLLHALEDGAAGYRWLSYTYVCRRR